MNTGPNEAWLGICALAIKDGVKIPEIPDGIYRRDIAEWKITFNGTNEDKVDAGIDLPKFEAYVQYNGWPAGLIGPAGGILAAGAAANEDTFIAAIEAELGCSINEQFHRSKP